MYKTVKAVYEELQNIIESGYGDAPVRIAYQPNWPLAAYVENVEYIKGDEDDERPNAVWFAASGDGMSYDESPYAPRELWECW